MNRTILIIVAMFATFYAHCHQGIVNSLHSHSLSIQNRPSDEEILIHHDASLLLLPAIATLAIASPTSLSRQGHTKCHELPPLPLDNTLLPQEKILREILVEPLGRPLSVPKNPEIVLLRLQLQRLSATNDKKAAASSPDNTQYKKGTFKNRSVESTSSPNIPSLYEIVILSPIPLVPLYPL